MAKADYQTIRPNSPKSAEKPSLLCHALLCHALMDQAIPLSLPPPP